MYACKVSSNSRSVCIVCAVSKFYKICHCYNTFKWKKQSGSEKKACMWKTVEGAPAPIVPCLVLDLGGRWL